MRLVKGLLERCFEMIELLAADAQWHRLSDIAAALDLQKGPAHRLLSEMCTFGWVEREAVTERYRLTLKLALFGQQYLRSAGLPGLVQPVLDEVARRCRELVRVTVVQGQHLHWFASAQGAPPGLVYQPDMGGRPVLHATANGKAWLATFSDAEATRLAVQGGLGQPLPTGRSPGPNALGTVEALLRELAATRARGYGLALEEAEAGVKALAVAVHALDGARVLGTVSIAGPVLRMGPGREAEFHALLQQAAGTLGMIWPRDGAPGAASASAPAPAPAPDGAAGAPA